MNSFIEKINNMCVYLHVSRIRFDCSYGIHVSLLFDLCVFFILFIYIYDLLFMVWKCPYIHDWMEVWMNERMNVWMDVCVCIVWLVSFAVHLFSGIQTHIQVWTGDWLWTNFITIKYEINIHTYVYNIYNTYFDINSKYVKLNTIL